MNIVIAMEAPDVWMDTAELSKNKARFLVNLSM